MPRWYVSFHGGAEPNRLNHLHAYDTAGQPLGKVLTLDDGKPNSPELRELRGFTYGPDGLLYVVNGYCLYSQILAFSGEQEDGRHAFRGVLVPGPAAGPTAMSHPFDLAFGPGGDLFVSIFVSNQDTNVVSRYRGPLDPAGTPGDPVPPTALADLSPLLPGTFVPSAKHGRDGLRAVRGLALTPNGVLLVADRDADCIGKYDAASGRLLGEITSHLLKEPIHVHLETDGRTLFIGSKGNNSVLVCDLADEHCTALVAQGAGGLNGPAGLAVHDRALYVCSRLTRQVLRFRLSDGTPTGSPFIDGLSDEPEFIHLVP